MNSKLVPVCCFVVFVSLLTVLFVLVFHQRHLREEPNEPDPSITSGNGTDLDGTRSRMLIELEQDLPTALKCPRCAQKHLKDYLCDSGFALLVKVLDSGTTYKSGLTSYVIERNGTLKSQPLLGVALSRRLIFTNSTRSPGSDGEKPSGFGYRDECFLKFEPNEIYLVTGRVDDLNALITECDLVFKWNSITSEDQINFKSLFSPELKCS